MKTGSRKPKEPVFILAPIGSKGSLLAAALGRHPGLFAAPHLNVLAFESLRQLIRFSKVPRDVHSHGVVRMLSWLLMGEESIEASQAARRWIGRHENAETKDLHQKICGWLEPRRLVEYSPLYTYHRRVVERVVAAAPNATFIHLVRHPTGTTMEIAYASAQTIDAALGRYTGQDANQPCLDILELTDTAIDWQGEPVFDPQFLWYRAHTAIAEVLAELPRNRVMRVRAEDLLAEPENTLAAICRRLRLPVTSEIVRTMLRTEQDIFARPGPFGTSRGIDWDLMVDPTFPEPEAAAPLAGSLRWRGDGGGYRAEVIGLAEQFGYLLAGGLGRAPARFKIVPPAVISMDGAAVSP